MNLAEARAAFPVLEGLAYLNAGSFGPLARSTVEAMARRTLRDLEEGRAGKAYFEEMLALREDLRRRIASLLCSEPANVALTTSTTEGCNLVLAGLGLSPEDEVVTTDSEHFGLLGPLQASVARVRVAEVSHEPPERHVEVILGEVGPRTRLLALSHVTWTTGTLLPIQELKEQTGLPMLVDGAQSAGAMPVDARPFDFYTVSGQKWLCGPESTGALYVADPDGLRVSAPTYFSQQAYSFEEAFTPRAGAARFDSGWTPVAALAGWADALELAPEWRYSRASEQAARCYAMLAEAGHEIVTPPGQATLVSIRLPDPAAAVSRAYDQGVIVRDLPGTGLLRASCGWWTNDEDLERLLAALAA